MSDEHKRTGAGRQFESRTSSSADSRSAEELEEGGAPLNRRVLTPGGHTLDRSQPAFPVFHRKFANPAPLGLSGFALTTFMLSLINLSARGVTVPNVVVGPAIFYGGVVQFLAGMWEFAEGNTFGATAFTSYGAFWISYAFIVSPWSGIGGAYDNPQELKNGVAFFLFGFFIFTTILTLATLRASIALFFVFFTVDCTFLMLGLSELGIGNASALQVAGGSFGIVAAFAAWYVAAVSLINPTGFFNLPVGDLSRKAD
ncbi:hypothetical protein JCM3766R1_002358 [Sporobolomyces carnicolor]